MAQRRRRRGRFIVLEGLDGAGTTTQTAELARRLRKRGLKVHTTAEPTRGPIGLLIRLALGKRLRGEGGRPFDRSALALLFAADRLDHLAVEVVPRLAKGDWVISDRYVLSSLAYQSLDLPLAFVEAINERAPKPDLTLLLKVPADVALKRRLGEQSNADLFETLWLQRRIAKNYQSLLSDGRHKRGTVTIDGTASVLAVSVDLEHKVVQWFGL